MRITGKLVLYAVGRLVLFAAGLMLATQIVASEYGWPAHGLGFWSSAGLGLAFVLITFELKMSEHETVTETKTYR